MWFVCMYFQLMKVQLNCNCYTRLWLIPCKNTHGVYSLNSFYNIESAGKVSLSYSYTKDSSVLVLYYDIKVSQNCVIISYKFSLLSVIKGYTKYRLDSQNCVIISHKFSPCSIKGYISIVYSTAALKFNHCGLMSVSWPRSVLDHGSPLWNRPFN